MIGQRRRLLLMGAGVLTPANGITLDNGTTFVTLDDGKTYVVLDSPPVSGGLLDQNGNLLTDEVGNYLIDQTG